MADPETKAEARAAALAVKEASRVVREALRSEQREMPDEVKRALGRLEDNYWRIEQRLTRW